MVGTGLYTPRDAARLLHEKPATVRRWAFGYERNRADGKIEYPPLISTELPPIEGEPALTFIELVELRYIRAFLRAGVTWRVMREAASVAARMYNTKHPFALRKFYADPKAVYAEIEDDMLVQLIGHGQHTIVNVVKPYLDELAFGSDDLATQWRPLGRTGGVLIDPRFSFGAPIIEDVGIRTRTLSETYLAERPRFGERTVERVAWVFGIKPTHVESALRFRTWLMTPNEN